MKPFDRSLMDHPDSDRLLSRELETTLTELRWVVAEH
jgi:hypothetical protein